MVDWFKGLSGKFLGSRAGKLLLLAGTDRLDKPLMIGQMQGILPPTTVIAAFVYWISQCVYLD